MQSRYNNYIDRLSCYVEPENLTQDKVGYCEWSRPRQEIKIFPAG
jgi:hypothetical protein